MVSNAHSVLEQKHKYCADRKRCDRQNAFCCMAARDGTRQRRREALSSARLRLKCHGTCANTRFRLSAKRTSPFKSAGASVQSTTSSLGVRISCSNAGYNMFQGSVKSTGYPFHSPVSPSLRLPASPCTITFQLDSTPFGYSSSTNTNSNTDA